MLRASRQDREVEKFFGLVEFDAPSFLREQLQVPPLRQLGEHGAGRRQTKHLGAQAMNGMKTEGLISCVEKVPALRPRRHHIQAGVGLPAPGPHE